MGYNQELGKLGEESAVDYLISQGYEIITTNYRTRGGEIDIIATEGENIIFCEVKTRTSLSYGTPAVAVNRVKRNHIIRVAQCFLSSGAWSGYCPRFDVIEIYHIRKAHINHMINAFVADR